MSRFFRSGRAHLLVAFVLAVGMILTITYTQITTNTNFPAITSASTPGSATATVQALLDLHVSGNELVTSMSHQVILRGVDRDESDFLCAQGQGIFDGPTGPNSIAALINWRINSVRIPLNEACWLGLDNLPAAFSGVAYQNAIAAYTEELNAHGIYVILDLHKNASGSTIDTHTFQPMPDADHSLTFWQQVATRFKDNGMVLFDLFNEPHPPTWACWRDGGSCAGIAYLTVGMQSIVDTIRATGATNVLLLAGLNYANDLDGLLTHLPTDPLRNVAASWHVYTNSSNPCKSVSCYNATVAPIAAQIPLIATEFGTNVHGTYCGIGGMPTLLAWLDAHQAGYLAFSWNVGAQTCQSLSLISSYNGTPKAPNGTFYQAHLLAVAASVVISPAS